VAVRLIIIDLTNGLLTDEEMGAARAGASEMLEGLSRLYRLAAFADTPISGPDVRSRLEDLRLGGFFETVITSGDLGAALSPSVFHHVVSTVGTPPAQAAVISSQVEVVETLQMAGVVVLPAERGQPLTDLPEALAWVTAISSP
jgi:FMN phosphatase YigB (HAD superfamily)